MTIEVTEPPEPYSKKILLMVTPRMFDRLNDLTRKHGLSRNQLMRDLLQYGIEQLEQRTHEGDTAVEPQDDADQEFPAIDTPTPTIEWSDHDDQPDGDADDPDA